MLCCLVTWIRNLAVNKVFHSSVPRAFSSAGKAAKTCIFFHTLGLLLAITCTSCACWEMEVVRPRQGWSHAALQMLHLSGDETGCFWFCLGFCLYKCWLHGCRALWVCQLGYAVIWAVGSGKGVNYLGMLLHHWWKFFFFFFLPSGSTPLCLLNAVKYDKVTHPALVTMSTNKFGFSMHCHCLAGLSL